MRSLPNEVNRGPIFNAFFGTSVSSVLVTGVTFLSGVLISRTLGPEGRGEYGAVLLVAQTAATLGGLSFFDAAVVLLQRRGGRVTEMLPTLIVAALAITAMASAAVVLVLPWLDLGLHEVSLRFFIGFTVLTILAQVLGQCFAAGERSQLRFMMVNASRVSAPAAFSVLVAAAWLWAGSTLTVTLVLGLFVVSKLPVIAAWLWLYRKHLFGRFLSWSFARDTMGTGLRLHVAVALGAVATQLDRLIAIGSWPKDLLGQYFVAFSAVGAGYAIITTAMNTVLFPYLASVEPNERPARIGQIIRLTLLMSGATVLVGLAILPFAVPLLYGAAFAPATNLALGLLLALSILPLRAIVLEAGRSLGKGRPSVEMAVVSIAVIYAGFLLTNFSEPWMMIAAVGLSNVASTIVGARHMLADGDIRLDRSMLPSFDDVRLLRSILKRAGWWGAR